MVFPLQVYPFRLGVVSAFVPCIPLGTLLTAGVGEVGDSVTGELEERISRKLSGFSLVRLAPRISDFHVARIRVVKFGWLSGEKL